MYTQFARSTEYFSNHRFPTFFPPLDLLTYINSTKSKKTDKERKKKNLKTYSDSRFRFIIGGYVNEVHRKYILWCVYLYSFHWMLLWCVPSVSIRGIFIPVNIIFGVRMMYFKSRMVDMVTGNIVIEYCCFCAHRFYEIGFSLSVGILSDL